MTRFWKISNLIILGLLVLICGLGTFYKHISFGLGLADMLGYFILFTGTSIHAIMTITSRKMGRLRHAFLTVTFSTFTMLIILNATIWRGQEYGWNGRFFYLPCPTEIKIDNKEIQKEELITMCSMDYYSEFSGNWNGQFLTIKKGEIKVPEELEPFIDYPITRVEIVPDTHEIFGDLGRIKAFYFKKDTMQTNQEYNVEGEIRAIRNKVPVILARIK